MRTQTLTGSGSILREHLSLHMHFPVSVTFVIIIREVKFKGEIEVCDLQNP